jgi:mycothiol system anti-sigma-R factor
MVEQQQESADSAPVEADCEETIERLYWFLDGELTEERRVAIRAHLDDCGPCLQAMGFETELRRLVADRCRDRVPDGLRERIAAAIHLERVTQERID